MPQLQEIHAIALSAITRTVHRYAYAVDEIDREMLMDTFTQDSCLEASVAHGNPVPRLEGALPRLPISSCRGEIGRAHV